MTNILPPQTPHYPQQPEQPPWAHETQQYPQPALSSPPPPSTGPAAAKRARRWPWVLGIIGSLFVGIGIGSAGGGTATPTDQAAPLATPATIVKTITVTPTAGSPATVVKTVTKTVTVTAKAPAPAPAATIPGDGVFLVPSDVKPGTYRSTGAESGNCYWARLANTNGDLNSINANGNVSGPVVVTIKSSDKAFESTGCADWTRAG